MRQSRWPWIFLVALLGSAAGALAAQPPEPRYNTVQLQADVQREVQNDLLTATLYAELSDSSPAALASAMNQRVNEALRVAKAYPGVRARSGASRTYPVYTKGNVLQGWRGRAEIRIDSRDFEAASGLIGELQATLQLAQVGFAVAPETRRAVENELIAEAIHAFKARAEIIRDALAGDGYKLQNLNVSGGHGAPPPRPLMARDAAPAQSVVAPEFEAGVSVLTVTASGAIEIIGK
jgi:predicted secreted protein